MLSSVLYFIGAAVALASAVHAHGGYGPLSLSWAGWLAWIILPYAILGAVSTASRRSPPRLALRRANLGAGLAALIGTLVFYRALWFDPHHSTEGLVFIFAPAFLLIAGLVVFGILYAITYAISHENREGSRPAPSAHSDLGPHDR